MIQQVMLSASDLARRWGRSPRWVRENVIKPKAVAVYPIGKRDPLVCLSDIRVIEARAKVKSEPAARERLLAVLNGTAKRNSRRNERGRYIGSDKDS